MQVEEWNLNWYQDVNLTEVYREKHFLHYPK